MHIEKILNISSIDRYTPSKLKKFFAIALLVLFEISAASFASISIHSSDIISQIYDANKEILKIPPQIIPLCLKVSECQNRLGEKISFWAWGKMGIFPQARKEKGKF